MANRGCARLSVSNTYLPILEKFKELYGGGVCAQKDPRPNKRQLYSWNVTGPNVRTLLRAVEPFLVEKRRQAQIALKLHELPLGERGDLIHELTRLKRIEYLKK